MAQQTLDPEIKTAIGASFPLQVRAAAGQECACNHAANLRIMPFKPVPFCLSEKSQIREDGAAVHLEYLVEANVLHALP